MDIKEYFKHYPGSNQCFQTSDGLIFHQEGDARLHGNSLKNKEIKAFSNLKEDYEHTLTEDDFVNNPELTDEGLQPGEKIIIPAGIEEFPKEDKEAINPEEDVLPAEEPPVEEKEEEKKPVKSSNAKAAKAKS